MYLSKRYRPNKWPFWGLIAVEFPITVALLALFGIAAPNLYRTKLWQDGADNGFNSSPKTGLYAAANYKPYTAPKVWGQFITNFNIVISVFSMFLMLTKTAMYMLKVWPPLLSAVAHAALIAIYIVSVIYQTSPDMSDPKRPQPGAPWYIMKSCSVTKDKSLVGYCMQAKAAFACTVVILAIFVFQFILAVISIFPSRTHAAERESKRLARESRWAHLDSLPASPTKESAPSMSLNELARPGTGNTQLNPQTPRTLAFNRLGGTRDLPLRNHFAGGADEESAGAATGVQPKSPGFPSRFALRSPTFPKSPLSPGFERAERKVEQEMSLGGRLEGAAGPSASAGASASANAGASAGGNGSGNGNGGMYFPPPPKVAVKGK